MKKQSTYAVLVAAALGGLVSASMVQTLRAEDVDSGSGLAAHYYRDPPHWNGAWPDAKPVPTANASAWTFTRYAYTRKEPLVNHLFIREGWFTVRWQGSLTTHPGHPDSNEAHDYRLTIWADDGCRLMIDGEPLIDSWEACSESSPGSRRSITVSLTQGKHAISLEYFQGQSLEQDDADPVKLYWACADRGIPEQIIPATHLSHDGEDLIPQPGRED